MYKLITINKYIISSHVARPPPSFAVSFLLMEGEGESSFTLEERSRLPSHSSLERDTGVFSLARLSKVRISNSCDAPRSSTGLGGEPSSLVAASPVPSAPLSLSPTPELSSGESLMLSLEPLGALAQVLSSVDLLPWGSSPPTRTFRDWKALCIVGVEMGITSTTVGGPPTPPSPPPPPPPISPRSSRGCVREEVGVVSSGGGRWRSLAMRAILACLRWRLLRRSACLPAMQRMWSSNRSWAERAGLLCCLFLEEEDEEEGLGCTVMNMPLVLAGSVAMSTSYGWRWKGAVICLLSFVHNYDFSMC